MGDVFVFCFLLSLEMSVWSKQKRLERDVAFHDLSPHTKLGGGGTRYLNPTVLVEYPRKKYTQ